MQIDLAQVRSYFGDPGVPRWSKLAGLVALLYVFAPVDLIPDLAPVVGWLDDAGVVTAAAAWYLRRIARHARRPTTLPVRTGRTPGPES